MRLIHLIFIACAAVAGPGAFAHRAVAAESTVHNHKQLYQCPMHPQVVRDQPGECPICHMQLQPIDGPAPAAPVKPAGPGAAQAEPSAPAGHAAFSLSAERRQLIGVRSGEAKKQAVTKTLRLPGRMGDDRRTVLAQALEMDGGVIKGGLKAEILVRGGAPKLARVVHMDRSLDSYTRTYGVLLGLLESPDALMRPGVYVDVRVELQLAQGVAVPKEAVLDTGDRQMVFVQHADGRFEPREVQVGAEGDRLMEIKRGVAAGEQVVTSANFLIDSESRFRSAAQGFSGGQP